MFATTWLRRWLPLFLLLPLALPLASPTLAQDDPAEVEFVGPIQAVDGTTLTVGGLSVDISAAQVRTPLALDALVRVEGVLLPDGSIVAREVRAATLPDEAEFVGLVDALTAEAVVVSGLSFDVRAAEVGPGVAVGARVKVHATLSTEGVWVARQVALFIPDRAGDDDDGDDDRAELVGTLQEVGADYIVVSGQRISTVGAEIHDPLVVGLLVRVHLRLQGADLVAREVELARPHFDDDFDNFDDDDDTAIVIPEGCVAVRPAGWTAYTVQQGDTLSSIAARTGGSIRQLLVSNCIRDPRFIVVGMELFVPQTPAPLLGPGRFDDDDGGWDDDDRDDDDDHGDHDDDDGNEDHDDDRDDD